LAPGVKASNHRAPARAVLVTATIPFPTPIPLAPRARVLIVKLSSIGDVVHALPVATALRRRFPQMELTWAVERWVAPVLDGHRAVDRVVTFPPLRWGAASRRWLRQSRIAVRALRREAYDVSLDLQGLLKSAALVFLANAPRRIAVPDAREGAWVVSRRLPTPAEPLHVVDFNLQCAAALGADPTPVDFGLGPAPHAVAAVDARLTALGLGRPTPFAVINPSASAPWKQWAPVQWATVAAAIAADMPVVLVGTSAHRAAHAQVAAAAAHPAVFDLTGTTRLADLIALLDRCAVHLAGDTGSLHVAAALGRPVVGVYGPTPPWRKGPFGQADNVVHRRDLCRATCPRLCRRQRCLEAVTPEAVSRTLCVGDDATGQPAREACPCGSSCLRASVVRNAG